jgi:hypothetical protein
MNSYPVSNYQTRNQSIQEKTTINTPKNHSIPTLLTMNYGSNQETRPHYTHTQSHEQTPPPPNHDKPECSNNHNHTHYPSFSYYPEQIVEEGIKTCQRSILGKSITEKPIHVSSIQNGLESI